MGNLQARVLSPAEMFSHQGSEVHPAPLGIQYRELGDKAARA